jgi:hypothetical protein
MTYEKTQDANFEYMGKSYQYHFDSFMVKASPQTWPRMGLPRR